MRERTGSASMPSSPASRPASPGDSTPARAAVTAVRVDRVIMVGWRHHYLRISVKYYGYTEVSTPVARQEARLASPPRPLA